MSIRPLGREKTRWVAWSLEEVSPVPSAVTIGFFDGVHRGHQQLIERAGLHAASRSLRTVAATFDRHPSQVLRPGSEPPLLMTLERRVGTLHRVGADLVLVIPFTPELAELSPEAFVEVVLVDALDAHVVVVGQNFRFGHLAAGDVHALGKLAGPRGVDVDVVELLTLEGIPLSSTQIRRHLAKGDVEWAAAALGRPHMVDGVVVPGEGRGRAIGIPTANVAVSPHAQLPSNGVYAGHVEIVSDDVPSQPAPSRSQSSPPAGPTALPPAGEDARRLPAVTNIGVRPTFGGETLTVETHLLDFEGDLYGAFVTIEFTHRLRDERRFADRDELVAQIRADIARGRDLLARGDG